MQRLVAGSARIGQRIAAAVNPSGSVFNDLRPPMPDEAIAGLSGLARGLVTGKRIDFLWRLIENNIISYSANPYKLSKSENLAKNPYKLSYL